MSKIYSYVLRYDDGAAPNPFGGVCTLAICKPAIRRKAEVGAWVLGTGSKNAKCNDGNIYDLSDSVVYAMKISNIKTLHDYDQYCKRELNSKIPDWDSDDWRQKIGDNIYDYSKGTDPAIRKSVHNENNRQRDQSGNNVLLSNQFYYFGEEARPLPADLKSLIKKSQGHKIIENVELISKFETWIGQFEKNKIYADPQLRSEFEKKYGEEFISNCSTRHLEDDEDETEEPIC